MTRSRLYRSGLLQHEDFPATEAAHHLTDPSVTPWLDLDAPTAHDLAALTTELGLHPLAVASVLDEDHQRPKLARYDAFITDRVLITMHRDNTTDIDALTARWDTTPEPAPSMSRHPRASRAQMSPACSAVTGLGPAHR